MIDRPRLPAALRAGVNRRAHAAGVAAAARVFTIERARLGALAVDLLARGISVSEVAAALRLPPERPRPGRKG